MPVINQSVCRRGFDEIAEEIRQDWDTRLKSTQNLRCARHADVDIPATVVVGARRDLRRSSLAPGADCYWVSFSIVTE